MSEAGLVQTRLQLCTPPNSGTLAQPLPLQASLVRNCIVQAWRRRRAGHRRVCTGAGARPSMAPDFQHTDDVTTDIAHPDHAMPALLSCRTAGALQHSFASRGAGDSTSSCDLHAGRHLAVNHTRTEWDASESLLDRHSLACAGGAAAAQEDTAIRHDAHLAGPCWRALVLHAAAASQRVVRRRFTELACNSEPIPNGSPL